MGKRERVQERSVLVGGEEDEDAQINDMRPLTTNETGGVVEALACGGMGHGFESYQSKNSLFYSLKE